MTDIRALTVRQPWAWAIIHGGKDVENRTKSIAGAYRGPVLIHAARRGDNEGYRMLGTKTGPFATWTDDLVDDALGAPSEGGVFIGVVNLVEVHLPGRSWQDGETGRCSEWAQGGQVHLVLATPRPLSRPIPYKGRLGLWRIDTDEIPGLEEML